MKDFDVKQKKSKWSIIAKDFYTLFQWLPLVAGVHIMVFGLVYYLFYPENPYLLFAWIMNHWYLCIVGWISIIGTIWILLYQALYAILYQVYRYINRLTFKMYLPLTMEDLKNNHVKNQSDFVIFLLIYKKRKVKILSKSYNATYDFKYSDDDINKLRKLYLQFPDDSMSKEFEMFYLEYLKKYDMSRKIEEWAFIYHQKLMEKY